MIGSPARHAALAVGLDGAVALEEIVDDGKPLRPAVQARAAGEQGLGIGMLRPFEDRLHVALLLDLAALHHHHVVGDLAHHAEVVGDEEQRHVVLFLQAREQVEDLLLDGDVERGGRLVGDQELGLAGDRHRDHDALLLAARQLVRVGVDAQLRIGDADFVQERHDAVPRLLAGEPHVQAQHLADLLAHREHGVERRHRLLEDHREVAAAQLAQFAVLRLQQVLVAVEDAARRRDDRVLRQQAEDRHGGDRLAAAGLAHQRHRAVGRHLEGDALHRVEHGVLVQAEADVEVLDLEDDAMLVLGRHGVTSASDRAHRAANR